MLSKELEITLNNAFKDARAKRHEFMTVEHLLLALLSSPVVINVLKACGANVNKIKEELTVFIDETTPIIPMNEPYKETQPTLGFQRVLQRAVFHVQSAGKDEVTGANVLAAIFSEQDSQAVYLLSRSNVTRLDIVNFIAHGITKAPRSDQPIDIQSLDDENSGDVSRSPLEAYAVNLNSNAKIGKIDLLVGRDEEVKRMIQVLCRRRKNNPLFVGEAGVGKTAIVEGLAKLIVENKVPPQLKDATIYSLDLGSLLAGTKYRGDFEKRLKAMLSQLKKDPEAILFIDEIHTIIGAGAASGGVMDASNLIKPLLSSGELRCIGSTTYQEYRGIFEKDKALARRFQKIEIKEPSVNETMIILNGIKGQLEEFHNVKYTTSAIKAAVLMSERFIVDRFLPDKAIDVLDEAGSYHKLNSKGQAQNSKLIKVSDIEYIVAKMARIPLKNASNSDKEILKSLEYDLKQVIYGQDKAVHALVSAVKMGRSGLNDEGKPIASFLFAGPTGVGKTELTKQLATLLNLQLLRFDMSEYMESHSVSRLIGAPPGYVGFEQNGLLSDAILKNPHSILLLDEIEKAHPDITNLLLQVMDHGTLTDHNGRRVDFRHVIIVMTTNAGADVLSKNNIGFLMQDNSSEGLEAIKKKFSPEFRNRLDGIIQFNALSTDSINLIVDKMLKELNNKLSDKKVKMIVSDEAKSWLAKNGFDDKMGARPMARLISEKIKKPLAEIILFDNKNEVSNLVVDLTDNDLVVKHLKIENKDTILPKQVPTDKSISEHNKDIAKAVSKRIRKAPVTYK